MPAQGARRPPRRGWIATGPSSIYVYVCITVYIYVWVWEVYKECMYVCRFVHTYVIGSDPESVVAASVTIPTAKVSAWLSRAMYAQVSLQRLRYVSFPPYVGLELA